MTNLEKIERFKLLFNEAEEVNRPFTAWAVMQMYLKCFEFGVTLLEEAIDENVDYTFIEMLLKTELELNMLPNLSIVNKGAKDSRTTNQDLKEYTGLQYLRRLTIQKSLNVQPILDKLYPTTKLKPIDPNVYKSFDTQNTKLYNLFRPFFDKSSVNPLYKGAGLNFDEKGVQYTNGHCLIRINSEYVKTLPDKREIFENSGMEKGCFIVESKKLKPYKFPDNHEQMVKKLPLNQDSTVDLNQIQLEKLILLLEQMEHFNTQSIGKSVLLLIGEGRIDVSINYLKHILHILSTEGNGVQISVRKREKEKGVISWSSLVMSPDLAKFTELEASGALLMPMHIEKNVFKIDVETQQLCIIT